MEIIVAKNAGFCFGVKRAIEKTQDILCEKKGKVFSIGSLIHNELVTDDLKKKGLIEIDDISMISDIKNETVIIRTHGVEKEIYDILKKNNNEIIDLTCPFVKKIHDIVDEYSTKNYKIIVIGDKRHPEVRGIVSYGHEVSVVSTEDDIKKLTFDRKDKVLVVSQTTESVDKVEKLVDILRDFYYNIEVVNTICSTTIERQEEVGTLAKVLDVVIIIGSENSSNTMKLYNIASKYCNKTYIVSNRAYVKSIDLDDNMKVGICAGASTPQYLIEEIIEDVRNEL